MNDRGRLHALCDLGAPVTAAEAAAALDLEVASVLSLAADLTGDGSIREEGAGWIAVVPSEASGPERALLAGSLADALVDADPGRRGSLLVTAGRPGEAMPLLVAAGVAGDASAAALALEVGPPDDPIDAGRLHLSLAAHERAQGRSEPALDHARRAIPLLAGPDAVDALGFVAQIHDDLQRSHAGATWAMLGAGAANELGDPAKEGSLLTLGARSLSRLGFADEAEATIARGRALVEAHGTPTQRARATLNRAWVLLDHGRASAAADAFAGLGDLAAYLGDEPVQAARLASEARARFRASDTEAALARYAQAMELGDGAPAPSFLAHLAFAEGATLHGVGGPAVDAAVAAVEVADAQMPQWRNVAHLTAAAAHRVDGNAEQAADHLTSAREHTPAGIDGRRIRLRCEVEDLAQLTDRDRWPRERAATLTDALLQAGWLGTALDLMVLRAGREKGTDIADQAVALAARLGTPLPAAQAAEAGGRWSTAAGALAARMVADADPFVAEVWREHWDGLPEVIAARSATATPDDDAVDARLEAALATAGLGGDEVSPAQRASRGLSHRSRRTARGWLTPALATAAVVIAAVALVATLWPEAEEPAIAASTTVPAPTTTTLPIIQAPELWAGGFHAHRGDPAGTGVSDGGIATADGIYWAPVRPAGASRVGAVASGVRLFVTSSDRDVVTQLDQSTGSESWQLAASGRLLVPLAVGTVGGESGAPVTYVVWTAEDGTLGVFDEGGSALWQTTQADLPGVSRGAPVIADGVVYVGRELDDGSGYVAAIDLARGTTTWRTDQLENPVEMNAVEASVSIHDGTVFVAPRGNQFLTLDAATGALGCTFNQTAGERPARPVVGDDFVVVPGDAGFLGFYPIDTCDPTSTRNLQWETDPGTGVAVADGQVFMVLEGGVIGIDPDATDPANPGSERLWPIVNPDGEGDRWTTSPVITGDLLIVGSADGEVAALDRTTGDKVWQWFVDGEVVDEVTPVKGAVFVVTTDGTVTAIAGPRLDG